MLNPRLLLILFALAFLGMQVVGYMSGITKHEERMLKLERQAVQFETRGTYIDLKMDPTLELKKEKARFKAETMNLVIKVLVISAATAFVFALMKPGNKKEES